MQETLESAKLTFTPDTWVVCEFRNSSMFCLTWPLNLLTMEPQTTPPTRPDTVITAVTIPAWQKLKVMLVDGDGDGVDGDGDGVDGDGDGVDDDDDDDE